MRMSFLNIEHNDENIMINCLNKEPNLELNVYITISDVYTHMTIHTYLNTHHMHLAYTQLHINVNIHIYTHIYSYLVT